MGLICNVDAAQTIANDNGFVVNKDNEIELINDKNYE